MKLVEQGNLKQVQRHLSKATEDLKDRLLKEEAPAGFNAGRLAVERNDELMIDLLLQHMTHFHITNSFVSDGMSVFTRAVQINPDWFAKFENVDTCENLLTLLVLEVDDLDNEKKYCELWNKFTTIFQGEARVSTLICKILRKRHRKLALKMLQEYGGTMKAPLLKGLLQKSVQLGNMDFFQQALNILPQCESVLDSILFGVLSRDNFRALNEMNEDRSRVRAACLDILFDSGRELTVEDINRLAGPDISADTVQQFLANGQFCEVFFQHGLEVGPSLTKEKFALFVDAGFFTAYEKSFNNCLNQVLNTEDPLMSPTDVPLLAALALVKVRQNILRQHMKNIFFVFERGLCSFLPNVLQRQIQHPFSDDQMTMLHTRVTDKKIVLQKRFFKDRVEKLFLFGNFDF